MTLHITAATLYDFPFSSASYRLRIAMHLKGVAPQQVKAINLRTGAQRDDTFVQVTGAPMVPALDFGTAAFGQSLALIEWLDDTHPDPRLIPEDADTALAVRSLALTIACDIHPLNTPRVLNYLSEEDRKNWYAHWVRAGFTALEHQLARTADHGPFCIGTTPTLADICLVPQVLNARRFGVAIDDFQRINAIDAHCQTLTAFKAAAPLTDQ